MCIGDCLSVLLIFPFLSCVAVRSRNISERIMSFRRWEIMAAAVPVCAERRAPEVSVECWS